ncbi:hypothetical protein [Metamycoplasma equirhinis]|uniref:hypothetical protein n=1 Tax=Metamycoplasma equirhinis TaxID=92402 RepID=UPI00359C2490
MNSNKKKTAIIVGSVATALLASAAIATALYLKGKNKLDKPKDKTTFIDFGISKEDQKEFGAHDAKVEEEFKKIRKYIEKIIENLNKGINEAKKDLSIQDYNVLINYLKDGIKIGEDAFPILDKSIKALAEYLEKQKLLQDDRKRLAETIEKAKEAIAYAQSKLDGLLKDKSKVEKRAETIIRQIKEAIERAEKGVIIPEFKASIKELEELSAAAEEIKTKAKIFDLNDIINKLDGAINDANAEIQILKDKISKQDEAAQKEAIKKFAEELKDKVDKAIKKGEDAQTVEELEEAKKQIDTLKDVASEAAKEANKLNEPEAKAKIESQIRRLEEESKKLNKRIEEKKAKDSELKNELKELLEELKKAGEDAQNAQSLNDLNKAIAELEAKIAKGQDLQPKLNQAKLTDEADTLKKALEKAAEILTDAKNRKDAENTRINELKNKLNNQKQDLESKTNNTKSKESISELENALSELNKSINDGESLNNEVKDDKSKESFKDEYNGFAKALADAKKQAQSSQQKLDALKQAKSELDRKVAEAISKANEAITEANNNKNSEDKDKLSSVLEQISKAKSELEKAKQDSETANDAENKKKCEDKLAELETAKAEIESQKTKVENKEKEIAKTKEAVKEQIEALNKEIAKVDKAISDKNKANIGLTKTELDKEIQKAEELLEKIKNEPKLNQEHIDLNSKITDAKNKSKAAEEALKNINKAEDDAKKATQEAKQELDKAINDAKTANPNKLDDLKEKQKQLDEAIEKGNKANKQADDAGVSDQTLKDKLAEAQTEKQKLEEKIKKAEQDNINQIKQKITDAISALDGAISKVNDATQDANKHDLEKTEEAIAKIANALKTANDTKSETEANQSKYQNEFNSLISKITDAKQKQTEILKQKQDIENERKVADEEYKTLKQNVDANILLFDGNSDNLDKVTEAISKLEKNLENAKKLLNESKKIKYSDLENKTSALITQIETKLIEARAKEQTLKNAQEAEKQRIEKLKDDLNAASQELENKSNILNNAQGLDNKQKALNELSEAITKANEIAKKVTDVDKTTNAKTEWENFNSKLTNATKLAQDKQKEITDKKLDLDNKIKTIEKKVTDAIQNASQAIGEKDKSKLQASKSELETLVNDLEKLKKETEQEKYAEGTKKVNDELTKVNEQLKKVSDELNSETNRISQVKEALEKATRDLKAAKTEAENNKDKVDELDKALRELETQYNLADAEYKKYNKPENTKVQELQKALQDLKNELDSYETFKNNLSKKNENTKKELDKKLENAKKEADKAIQDYDNAGEDKKKIEDAKKKLDDAKQKLDQITQDAENNGYDKAKKEAEEKSKEIDKKLKEAESKLNSKIAKELEDLINALNNQEESIKNLNKIDDLTQKLPPFLTLINNTQTSYNNLNTADNRKINEINSKLDRLNELLTTANGTYNNRDAYLSSKKTEIENAYKDAENKANPLLEQTKNLTGKLVADLTDLITNLQTAKEKANGAKSLASANGYSQYETKANELIKKIEDAIQIVTQAKTKLEGEDKLAKDLIKEIQEKIDAIDLETGKITEEIQEKIDDLKSLIDSLSSAVTEGIKFHNERNVDSNPITKRPDVIAAFGKLKDKTNISPKISDLNAHLTFNKKQVEDALRAATDFEISRRTLINKAKTEKKVEDLTQALSDLKEIQNRANKAKELESQKGYATKKTDIDTLVNRIAEEINVVEELLKQAKQTENERIQALIVEINKQINDLSTEKSSTEARFSNSATFNAQIENLEKELEKAETLKQKIDTETSAELTDSKTNLEKAINQANTTLELAKKKAKAIEQIEGLQELTFEESQDFINKINDADAESKINQIINEAEAKNKQNRDAKINEIRIKIEEIKSSLDNQTIAIENGIKTLTLSKLQNKLQNISSTIDDAKKYYLDNKDKYNELRSDFNELDSSIKKAEQIVKKANEHISSGKKEIDIEFGKLKNSQKEIEDFINEHPKANKADLDVWTKQKTKVEKLLQEANTLKQKINDKSYDEKKSEIDELINKIKQNQEKINNALSLIVKNDNAKQAIENLKWINKNEQNNYLSQLQNAQSDAEIETIKNQAIAKDEQYRNALEITHKANITTAKSIFNREELSKLEYIDIKNELNTLISQNEIDLTKYSNEKDYRTFTLEEINTKNTKLALVYNNFIVKIITKTKEIALKKYEALLKHVKDTIAELNNLKITSRTFNPSRLTSALFIMQGHQNSLEFDINSINKIKITSDNISQAEKDINKYLPNLSWYEEGNPYFANNFSNNIKEYIQKIQEKINEFENVKYPNLFSQDVAIKSKYAQIYKKYFDATFNENVKSEIYNLIWFNTEQPLDLVSNFNRFEQLYSALTKEITVEIDKANLKDLISKIKWASPQDSSLLANKIPSEAMSNIPVSQWNEKFILNYNENKFKFDDLNSESKFISKINILEDNIKIYEGFKLELKNIIWSDIDGKVLFKIKVSKGTLVQEITVECDPSIRLYKHSDFSYSLPTIEAIFYNDTNSVLTIDELINKLKTINEKVENDRFSEHIKFHKYLLASNEKLVVDKNSIKKLNAYEFSFKVKRIKEKVKHIVNGEQIEQEYEAWSKEIKLNIRTYLYAAREDWLKTNWNKLEFEYIGDDKSKYLPSEVPDSHFRYKNNIPWISQILNLKFDPFDQTGHIGIYFSKFKCDDIDKELNINNHYDKIVISGFKRHNMNSQTKFTLDIDKQNWNQILKYGIFSLITNDFNSQSLDKQLEVLRKFYKIDSPASIEYKQIRYRKGEAIFRLEYYETFKVANGKNNDGTINYDEIRKQFILELNLMQQALIFRYLRAFSGPGISWYSMLQDSNTAQTYVNSFDIVWSGASDEQKQDYEKLMAEINPTGKSDWIFKYNDFKFEHLKNEAIISEITNKYNELTKKIETWFSQFGESGKYVYEEFAKYQKGTGDFQIDGPDI